MGHNCNHTHHQDKNKNILLIAFILTITFASLEIVFSFISNSLALLSEGIHMFSDGVNLLLAFVAVIIGMKAATSKYNFGFRRIETITAFVNGIFLMVIPVIISIEAIKRFLNPHEVVSFNMLIIAFIGLVVNVIVAYFLHKGEKDSVNMKAAYLHVFSDLLSSVATIAAALIIMFTDFYLIDPIISVLVSVSIFIGGFKITKESFEILMEAVPSTINYDEVLNKLSNLDGVIEVSDLKIWCTTNNENYLLANIKTEDNVDLKIISNSIHDLAHEYNFAENIIYK